jgi:hypothetical protein
MLTKKTKSNNFGFNKDPLGEKKLERAKLSLISPILTFFISQKHAKKLPNLKKKWKNWKIQTSLRKRFWPNFASEVDQKRLYGSYFCTLTTNTGLSILLERWRWSRRVRRVEWRKVTPCEVCTPQIHSSGRIVHEKERERERKKRFGEWQEAMMIEPPARGRRLRPPAACALLWGAPGSPSWSALGPTQWAVVAEGAAGQGWTWLTAGGSFSLEHVPRALQCYLRATAANSNSSSRKSSPTKRTPPRMISKVSFFSHLCALFPPRVWFLVRYFAC